MKCLKINFGVNVLEKLSLPGVSEEIMWKHFDREVYPPLITIGEKFGYVNKTTQENILGGPAIVFHRHATTSIRGDFPQAAYTTPNGDRIRSIFGLDFNAL